MEIIPSIFFNYNAMRLVINYEGKKAAKKKRKSGSWVTDEINEKIKKIPGDK